MPQPIKKECDIELNGFSNLPDHAMWLGHIVSLSGALEGNLGYLLAYLTQASASVAIPMFHAVTSTDAQKAMLVAAAEQKLKGAELDEFRDLMEDFRTRYGERSRLVHNLWGTSPQHPGKAIWIHSKDATRLPTHGATIQREDEMDLFFQESRGTWRHCSTYTVKDMEDVYLRLNEYVQRVRAFIGKLYMQHPILGATPPSAQPDVLPPQDLDQGSDHR